MEDTINHNSIVVVTPVELQAMITEAVKSIIPQLTDFGRNNEASNSDTMTLDDAVIFISAHGLPTTRSSVYAHINRGTIPYRKIGKRLAFSKRELLEWIETRTTRPKVDKSEAVMHIARSATRKMREL